MALDVHLKRMGNSTWEFRLVGKRGFNISVTEAQIPERRRSKLAVQEEAVYSSPSSSSSESSDESQPSQRSQPSQPSKEVTSGLYDPVLDDTEVIYETIGPADSDQQSNQLEQPTEVQFEIKQFTDQPDLTRSLTSSPFLIPTKPYRPFSTEPLEVPPVEDPIILNPQYHDVFLSAIDTTVDTEGLTDDLPAASKFKLPISEQYDPSSDPTQEIKVVSNKIYVVEGDETVQKRQYSKSEEKNVSQMLLKKEKEIQNQNIRKEEQREYEYIENMKTEIDLEKIEATALNVVEESIQQAVVVAEDIRQEIDIELKQSEISSKEVYEEQIQAKTEMNFKYNEEHQQKSTEEKTESSIREEKTDLQTQIDVEEIKKTETLNRDREEIIIQNESSEEKHEYHINEEETSFENKMSENRAKSTHKSNLEDSSKSGITYKASNNEIHNVEDIAASRFSAEQRAYTIGLQTIPNIKGTLQSTNHFNLLLKTFFVHLTDVMVALSRFMLTEPVKLIANREVSVQEKDEAEINIKKGATKNNKIVNKETKISSQAQNFTTNKNATLNHRESVSSTTEEKYESDASNRIASNRKDQNLNKFSHLEETVTKDISKHELKIENEEIKQRKLSGAKIAQIEGMKPEELTNKMDKVISEFQKKSGTNDVIVSEQYSENDIGSRNIIEEEIESTQNEMKTMSYEAKSEKSLAKSEIVTHSRQESQQVIVNENKPITYVAIVEAHVYTNKDAIFEEQLRRMSETSYESSMSRSNEVKKMNIIKDAREESLKDLQASVAKSIESSAISSSQKSSTNLEKSVTQIALQKTTEVVEPVINIEMDKKLNVVQAQSTMQAATKTVASKTSVTLEEDNKVIHKQQQVSEKTNVLVEKPTKVVAEKLETFIDGNIQEVKTIKSILHAPKPTIEAPVKAVAEIKEIFVNEEDTKLIEKESVNLVKPKCAVDTTVKAVAEKIEVLVGDNIAQLETAKSVSSRQAQVAVNESVATVVTEISALEPKDEVLDVPEITVKQTQTAIHEPVLHIPEVIETCLAETKGDIEVPKVRPAQAKVEVQVAKVAAQAKVVTLERTEKEFDQTPSLASKSAKVIIEEPVAAQAEIHAVKVEEAKCEITDVTDSPKHYEEVNVEYKVELPKEEPKKVYQQESAELKIIKEQIIEITPPVEVYEDFELYMKKIGVEKEISQSVNIHEKSAKLEASRTDTIQSANTHSKSSQATAVTSQIELSQTDYQAHAESVEKKLQQVVQQSIATSSSHVDEKRKLTLRTDLTEKQFVEANGESNEITSPTSVPPTPLVDEYLFKLEATLPKNVTPVPRDCSVTPPSEHEDPNIVKKKLVPQIVDTNIEQVIYDPPLPTPTSPDKKSPPRYVKPGLRGGSDRPEITREEIMEIERKSSLLTSAIDETIRSIEEYKESVGIDIKQETKSEFSSQIVTEETSEQNTKVIVSNGYSDESDHEMHGSDNDSHVVIEETQNDSDVNETIEQSVVFNGKISNVSEHDEDSHVETNKIVDGEENHEDVVETVTINLSKMKRDSLQGTNTTVEESNDIEETIKLNGNSRLNGSSAESVYSDAVNEQQETKNFSATVEYTQKTLQETEKKDPLEGYRPVEFNPEAFKQRRQEEMLQTEQMSFEGRKVEVYKTDSGEIIGTQQGIVDGLEEPVVDPEIAKELGKPGIPEDKIATLISGEAGILREAHVMGLARVLKSHMHRTLDDDSSDEFLKIKPSIETLKDSEVLKALNEEILRNRDIKKKEERRWTTFLQKPSPKPKQKFVFCGNKEDALNYNFENLRLDEDDVYGEDEYRVRIVKQPKPRIAPDFKPEDFDTGPLPWEQRACVEEKEAAEAPPVEAEDPILIPEDQPEFVEAVDPLPESEVPDLEDTGIPLPPPLPPQQELPTFVVEETQYQEQPEYNTEEREKEEPEFQEASENLEEMDKNKISEQLLSNIESMVDPNATLEEQLAQMRAQLAALAQLPNVIQQTLELVTKQICQISQQKVTQQVQQITESQEQFVDAVSSVEETHTEQIVEERSNEVVEEQIQEAPQEPSMSVEEQERLRREEEERMIEEQKKLEQQKKELIEQMRIEQESRQVKQRSTPRVGKPRPMFGPPVPAERPVVLPGGRRWRRPEDAYNEQKINEALTAQAEVIKGKAIGVNFLKYEKPPVSLDHLQQSEVFKVVHNMDQKPLKQVELLTPVIAEADYRERARSLTPCRDMTDQRVSMAQQLQP